jgi:flavin-dependent dehydrogenase
LKKIVIIGGGLAGLINTLNLAQAGLEVILLEKQSYPFHRVCGEYISNETLPYFNSLHINPLDLGAIPITQFRLSSPQGKILEMPLDLGGFGLSRYLLDSYLASLAEKAGARIIQKINVLEVQSARAKTELNIDSPKIIITDQGEFRADLVIGAYGKRSNLDNFLQRKFFRQRSPYLGVKYHIKLPKLDKMAHPANLIALHNFKDGYCGISRIEDDKYCLCYLTTRENLKKWQSIESLEENVLQKNPFLKDIWLNAEFLFDKPKVINEISFAPKPLIENGILMCGDTAGMITPLCGNGMAMAIHSAKILSNLILQFIDNQIDTNNLRLEYQKKWRQVFATRLWLGRNVQKFFGSPLLSEILVQTAKNIPPFARLLVKNSHGEVF